MQIQSKLFLSSVLLALATAGPGLAQSDQEKLDGAKREVAVSWYGSMNVDDASAIIAALAKKYPFVKINRFRAANAAVLSKLDVEARARGLNVDVIDLDGFYVAQTIKRNYWIPYRSPELTVYPKELSDARGLWRGFLLPMW